MARVSVWEAAGRRIWMVDDERAVIAAPQDALDLVGDAWGHEAEVVAVPVALLSPEFFRLSSGLAGEVTQKLVNYHLVLAVVGDVSSYVAASDALGDYVRESNRGRHVWFVPDEAALRARLGG